MDAERPWQLWLFGLVWPAVWAVLACSLPRRWLGAVRLAALAGWGGTLVVLGWMGLRPPPPLWVWRPGGTGGEALAFALRADPWGLALATVCGALGLLAQGVGGELVERTRGDLVPLVGLLLASLGGNLFTASVGVLLWEVSWGVAVWIAGEGHSQRPVSFPGGVGVLFALLLTAPVHAGLAFGEEGWPDWVRAGTVVAGLWIAGVYPAVGWAEAAASLPKGGRTLIWTIQPALGLVLVGRACALGPVPGARALVPLLLLCALFAALWAGGEASLSRLAVTRAALLGLGMGMVPSIAWALPWMVLGGSLGVVLLEEGSGGRWLDAGWARALGLLSLAGVPLMPAFVGYVAGVSSATYLWWLGLANALSLAPYVGEGSSPAWRVPRPRWKEGGVCAVLVGLGFLALAFGPHPGWAGGAGAVASALGGVVGAVALAWLRGRISLVERGARGVARALDPLAWAQGAGWLAGGMGDGLRWALGLWEGRTALLWGMALVLVAALALGR
ncbi:MAG: hypothetical protein ACUVXH_04205 [Anaerolineae bacterium]